LNITFPVLIFAKSFSGLKTCQGLPGGCPWQKDLAESMGLALI